MISRIGMLAIIGIVLVALGSVAADSPPMGQIETSDVLVSLTECLGLLDVIINEVEVNSPEHDSSLSTVDWVELYNASEFDIDISRWFVEAHVVCESDSCEWGGIRWSDPIPTGTLIKAKGFYVVERANRWMTDGGTHALVLYAVLRLSNDIMLSVSIDSACDQSCENPYAVFVDSKNDLRTRQRYPDGSGAWCFAEGTPNGPNHAPE